MPGLKKKTRGNEKPGQASTYLTGYINRAIAGLNPFPLKSTVSESRIAVFLCRTPRGQ